LQRVVTLTGQMALFGSASEEEIAVLEIMDKLLNKGLSAVPPLLSH
jgi:hypothetical protein